MTHASRREFLGAAMAAPLLNAVGSMQTSQSKPSPRRPTRIRTITAGVALVNLEDRAAVEHALTFLERAQRAFEDGGYEVQTRRIAISWPLASSGLQPAQRHEPSLDAIRALDTLVDARATLLTLGAVNGAASPDRLALWVAEVMQATKRISCSIDVATIEHGVLRDQNRVAASAIRAIAATTPGGLGNFRFAAAANIPDGTPFFPVARHSGPPDFAVGVESAGLVGEALASAGAAEAARKALAASLNTELSRVAQIAVQVAQREKRNYLGIDASPAPGMDRSIGRAIEGFTRRPFGNASTLTACAVITDVLKRLDVKTCGYSGLMLPVLEDPVLAARAKDGTYGVQELLLYSSVCGTGLDLVPLAGDVPEDRLASLIGDVAALAAKWQKPLSARLFPVPGVAAGGAVHFNDPLLTDCVAMRLD